MPGILTKQDLELDFQRCLRWSRTPTVSAVGPGEPSGCAAGPLPLPEEVKRPWRAGLLVPQTLSAYLL